MTATTKPLVCRSCRRSQPESQFEVCRRVGDKVYRRKICQRCKVAVQRDRRLRLRHWVEEHKKTLACVRCGFGDYRALEFHHRHDEGKDFNIGDMVRLGLSIETIRAEIAKCDVLCANCHRIEHYRG